MCPFSVSRFELEKSVLETLPTAHTHFAELAAGAFYLALINWQELQRHPWKKSYRGK